MDSSEQLELARKVRAIADSELAKAEAYFDGSPAEICSVFLLEACRVMDLEHIKQLISTNPEHHVPRAEFDTFVRGWNPLLSILLPKMAEFDGIPIRESTLELREHVRQILYTLGTATVLRHSAEMIEFGMVVGSEEETRISLRMADRISVDHFLDALEPEKLRMAYGEGRRTQAPRAFDTETVKNVLELMKPLIFPWDTGRGLMIGYGADEAVDGFFVEAVFETADRWRSDAGIHPEAVVGNTTGAALSAVVLLLASFYGKHFHFVELGIRQIPNLNYSMALTIWQSPNELSQTISAVVNLPERHVRDAIELATVSREHASFFAKERMPYVPLLIRFSANHYVAPISSIFRNPFVGIRMLQGTYSQSFEQEVREHREKWMIEDLRHLFMGTRYRPALGPTKLRRAGKIVTDIDWAVLDVVTGELALFQLKWQDFNSSDVRRQRSKGRNFVDQVETWSAKIGQWIDEFGTDQLLRSLHISASSQSVSLHLFAVGRSNARFASYGIAGTAPELAVATWPQFTRLRYEVGPAASVISEIHSRLRGELSTEVERTPMRHELSLGGHTFVFEDIWNGFPTTD